MEVPHKTMFDLEQFSEVIVTNFLIKEETGDLDLNKELVDYFSFEIGQNFKGEISSEKITFDEDEPFKNEAFWKNVFSDQREVILFTGSAQYTEEIRKAILEKKKSRFEDPFTSQKRSLAERRFYTLNLDLFIIDAKTGKPLYTRTFKETKGYENPKQKASFAFFELIQRVKAKFFRNILGEASFQERYLIYN
jgi:hypothetical protein